MCVELFLSSAFPCSYFGTANTFLFSCFRIAGEMCTLSAPAECCTGALKAPNLQLKGACMLCSAGRVYSGIIQARFMLMEPSGWNPGFLNSGLRLTPGTSNWIQVTDKALEIPLLFMHLTQPKWSNWWVSAKYAPTAIKVNQVNLVLHMWDQDQNLSKSLFAFI